jgi:hypothetical protein
MTCRQFVLQTDLLSRLSGAQWRRYGGHAGDAALLNQLSLQLSQRPKTWRKEAAGPNRGVEALGERAETGWGQARSPGRIGALFLLRPA